MKLSDWFDQTKKPKGEFADEIGVTPQMISAYLSGKTWPTKERAKKIAEATGGRVTANDFVEIGQ